MKDDWIPYGNDGGGFYVNRRSAAENILFDLSKRDTVTQMEFTDKFLQEKFKITLKELNILIEENNPEKLV